MNLRKPSLILILLAVAISAVGIAVAVVSWNNVTTFWNIMVSVGWLVVLVYVAWKVLDNQRKLDEKLTKMLEQLEKILQHLSTEREPRDTDS